MDQERGLDTVNQHEQWLMAQNLVRNYAATELRQLIELLKPMIDGSYGPVAPRMVEVYMTALWDLGRLYRVYDAPKAPQEREQEQVEVPAAELQARVLDSLKALEGRRPR